MCWPETFLISDITAKAAARTFVNGWIALFDIPSTVSTDRGQQLQSAIGGS